MLAPSSTPPFTPLPHEQALFTSSPRIALSISTPAHFPGKQQQAFSLTSPSGLLYLTNRRIIFLPDKGTPQLQSFAAPILSLHDSHVTAPWFGPNVWAALLQPTQGGGLPMPSGGVVDLKFTFKDGGAFDFQTKYEQIRERLQQTVEVSRIHGEGTSSSGAAMNGADLANVNLEDLPAYQEESDGPLISPVAAVQAQTVGDSRTRPRSPQDVPTEAPPGYEEAQLAGPQGETERRTNEDR